MKIRKRYYNLSCTGETYLWIYIHRYFSRPNGKTSCHPYVFHSSQLLLSRLE